LNGSAKSAMPVALNVVAPGKSLICGGYGVEFISKLNKDQREYEGYIGHNIVISRTSSTKTNSMKSNRQFVLLDKNLYLKKRYYKRLEDIIEEQTDDEDFDIDDDDELVETKMKKKMNPFEKKLRKIVFQKNSDENDGADSTASTNTTMDTSTVSSASSSSLGKRLFQKVTRKNNRKNITEGIVIKLNHSSRPETKMTTTDDQLRLSTHSNSHNDFEDDDVEKELLNRKFLSNDFGRHESFSLPRGLSPRDSIHDTIRKLNLSASTLQKYQSNNKIQEKSPDTFLETLSARLQQTHEHVTNSLDGFCQRIGLSEQQGKEWRKKMNYTPLC